MLLMSTVLVSFETLSDEDEEHEGAAEESSKYSNSEIDMEGGRNVDLNYRRNSRSNSASSFRAAGSPGTRRRTEETSAIKNTTST